jgi:hypothetical protein
VGSNTSGLKFQQANGQPAGKTVMRILRISMKRRPETSKTNAAARKSDFNLLCRIRGILLKENLSLVIIVPVACEY